MSAGIAENTEAKIKPLDAAKKSCEEVARASPGDTHKIASELLMVAIDYYKDVRRQAQQSFFTALAASLIGTIFFIYATWKGMGNNGILSQNGLIAGGLIQVIAGINFFLYGKASRQFASFHICLERSNRFLLSNTLCENITCPIKRDITRQEIIRHMLNAPMLTLDIINHGEAESRKKGPKQEMRKEAEVKVESLLSWGTVFKFCIKTISHETKNTLNFINNASFDAVIETNYDACLDKLKRHPPEIVWAGKYPSKPVQPVLWKGEDAYVTLPEMIQAFKSILPILEYNKSNDVVSSLHTGIIEPAERWINDRQFQRINGGKTLSGVELERQLEKAQRLFAEHQCQFR